MGKRKNLWKKRKGVDRVNLAPRERPTFLPTQEMDRALSEAIEWERRRNLGPPVQHWRTEVQKLCEFKAKVFPAPWWKVIEVFQEHQAMEVEDALAHAREASEALAHDPEGQSDCSDEVGTSYVDVVKFASWRGHENPSV